MARRGYERSVLRGVSTIVAVAVLVGAFVAGAAGRGAVSNGRIAYLRPLGGNNPPYAHLFAVNADGSGVVDLTPPGYIDVRSFAWSPDGTRIAFSAIADGDQDPEIFVLSVASGSVRRLTSNYLPDFGPSWSPAAASSPSRASAPASRRSTGCAPTGARSGG